MTSFNRAISNLKARTRENTKFRIADTTAAAQAEGAATVNRAKDIANKLNILGPSAYVRISELKKQAVQKLIDNVDHSQVIDYL